MDIEPIIEAIRTQSIEGGIIKPAGYQIHHEEIFHELPSQARGKIAAKSLESLASYTIRHNGSGTAVFADIDSDKITSVLDWHDPDTASGWGNHRVFYQLKYTEDWEAWKGVSGRLLDQKKFAEFIEENLDCIEKPSAAEVLSVATTLSGKRNIEFTSVTNLHNGDRSIGWNEKTEAKTAGDLKVPSELLLKIPIFEGAENESTFEIRALFRYHISDGKLGFEVKLQKTEKIHRAAFKNVVGALREMLVSEGLDEDSIIFGSVAETPLSTLTNHKV
ncbi:DUF2303 family protein [Luteolibacter pohnpeiensis]|uniref:DUF2303 family protein n=1 Tax=Luteolibacter pohnpeiensis TaxID=454153 RepID=A0A934S992_9BACT|nr:DUF2303 family protein [Luteolibacter pohnpeiensis]MBK1883695.1 DUF2303 family protein [Luteolibacter pohnpeiensis]